jgi:hypothetical protein
MTEEYERGYQDAVKDLAKGIRLAAEEIEKNKHPSQAKVLRELAVELEMILQ